MTKPIPLSEVREGDFLVCNGKRTKVTQSYDSFLHAPEHCVNIPGSDWTIPMSVFQKLGITAERREPDKVVVHAERVPHVFDHSQVIRGFEITRPNSDEIDEFKGRRAFGERVRITLEEIE